MDDKNAEIALRKGYKIGRSLRLDNIDVDDLVQTVMVDCLRQGVTPTRSHLVYRGIDTWRTMRCERAVKEDKRKGLKLSDDNGFGKVDREDEVEKIMRGTSPRERRIVWLRFWQSKTLSEIAQDLGLSKETISQILRTLIERIRDENQGV